MVVVALGGALALRACVFEAYKIPSTSMEETLLVGDFLFVSKLHYGPRLPVTLGLPFTGRYAPRVRLPTTRLPGLSAYRRGDVVVFNHPPERGPIDRKTPYVKRLVGLPGDTVALVGKGVVVNGEPFPAPPHGRQLWRVELTDEGALDPADLDSLGARDRGGHGSQRLVEATQEASLRLAALPDVEAVFSFVRPPGDGSADFPPSPPSSLDDLGPLVVPRRGWSVMLDSRTWPLYRDAIWRELDPERADGGRNGPRRALGGFRIAGALTDRYTFRENHLFVLGDNRDDSADSRTWGFVPASHVVGKAVLVYVSWDAAAGRLRTERLFRHVR